MDEERRTGAVHNEFHGVAGFVVMAGDIRGSVTYSPTFVTATTDPVETAARELARTVGAQWRAEAAVAGLLDVTPLAIRWTADWGEHADHRELVGGRIGGGQGDLRSFTDAFLRLPHRRLVVLGDPGSGKSVLAMLLVLSLLERSAPDDPVPVLFSLASWDPGRQHLSAWLTDSLVKNYPRVDARTAARLVRDRRVLPVLDGLDELSPQSRSLAVLGLNKALADSSPVVLTCRTSEYRSTLHDADVLRRAAVVQANPVSQQEALDYLRTAVSPRWQHRWQPVFTALAHDPNGPLATALASPLMIGLLRTIYIEHTAEPVHLLDIRRLPDAAAIEDHLLSGLVPAAFPGTPPPPEMRRRGGWDEVRAAHWLRHLAVDLTRLGTEDLTWWRFDRRSPDWARSLRTGLVVGGTCFLLFFLLAANKATRWESAIALGAMLGVAVGGTFGLAGDPAGWNPRSAWTATGSLNAAPLMFWRGRRIRTPARLFMDYQVSMAACGVLYIAVLWVCYLLGFVLSFGALPFDTVPSLLHHRLYVTVPVVMSALACILWSITILGPPYGHEDAATPRRGLRQGRRRALTTALLAGVTPPVLALFFRVFVYDDLDLGALGTQHLVLIAVLLFVEIAILESAWGRYERTRIGQALRGRLPWRLTTFLEDAHQRGVLRQFGTGYQFRHARVRAQLAAN